MEPRPSDRLIDPTSRVELAQWLADATSRFHDLEDATLDTTEPDKDDAPHLDSAP